MAVLCFRKKHTYSDLQGKCAILLPDFNQIWCSPTDFHTSPQYQIWCSPTDFHTSPQYQISRKSVQWESRVLKTDIPIVVTSAVFIHRETFFFFWAQQSPVGRDILIHRGF
jgi:hypothetical protein